MYSYGKEQDPSGDSDEVHVSGNDKYKHKCNLDVAFCLFVFLLLLASLSYSPGLTLALSYWTVVSHGESDKRVEERCFIVL